MDFCASIITKPPFGKMLGLPLVFFQEGFLRKIIATFSSGIGLRIILKYLFRTADFYV